MHILGDQVPEGGEAIVVLDLMGASLIHNNYGLGAGPGPALPDYLRDRVPDQPLTTVNGEADQATLNTKLRVKNGLVSLNSSSEVGATEVFGNGLKDTVHGTFSDDGWTGQRVTDDGDRGDPTVVYSDNGWDEPYDLGSKVAFPVLEDDWRWPAQVQCYELGFAWEGEPGSRETAPDGTDYLHEDYFSDMLSDGTPYEGDVTISTSSDYYLNLTQPGSAPEDRVQADPENCIKGDDYIYFDSATKVMEINGQIEINGDLTFSASQGNKNKTINYTGRAAILVHGDATLNTDLLTCNDGDPSDYVNSFPERNIIGIMAEQDMALGDHAQLDLLGAFYAEGQISSDKQTVVMGTFVAEYFDMGNQVPDIYQVPALVQNLPLGMIANYPVLVYSPVFLEGVMNGATLKSVLKETWYLLIALLVVAVFATRMYMSEKRETHDVAETAANPLNLVPFRPASLPEPARRLTKQEHAREVIEQHQERLEEEPDTNESASLLQAMGNLARMKLGEYEEAASYYETLLSTYPDWKGVRRTYTNLAACYESLGDELRTQSVYKRMMKAFPEDSQEFLFAKSELGL